MNDSYRKQIEEAWDCRQLLTDPAYKEAVIHTVDQLDKGVLRSAMPTAGMSTNGSKRPYCSISAFAAWSNTRWVPSNTTTRYL